MKEETIVRENLMIEKGYSPYCGNNISRDEMGGCSNPRTNWSERQEQFICPSCGWVSAFPKDFIERYKKQWHL